MVLHDDPSDQSRFSVSLKLMMETWSYLSNITDQNGKQTCKSKLRFVELSEILCIHRNIIKQLLIFFAYSALSVLILASYQGIHCLHSATNHVAFATKHPTTSCLPPTHQPPLLPSPGTNSHPSPPSSLPPSHPLPSSLRFILFFLQCLPTSLSLPPSAALSVSPSGTCSRRR